MSKRSANEINNLCSQMNKLLSQRIEILRQKGYSKNLIEAMIENEKREVCSSSNGMSRRPKRRRKNEKNLTEQFERMFK